MGQKTIQKTYKIGECAIGGLICTEIDPSYVTIESRLWEFNKPKMSVNKGNSSLLGSKRFLHHEATEMIEYLEELSTYYYATMILADIKESMNKFYF